MAEDSSAGNGVGGNGGELSPASKNSGNATAVGAPPTAESEYWPALSESIRAPSKFVPADSLKSLSLGPPNTPSQGSSKGLEKQTFSILNPKPTQTPSNAGFTRQNSISRGGNSSRAGYSKPANGSLSQPSSSTPASPSSFGDHGDHSRKTAGQSNDQHPFRRNHSGPLFRGDSRGNTRDQDRRKKDWGSTRSFNSREIHHPPQQTVGYRSPFIHGAPPVGPFAPFQQAPSIGFQPFTTQMIYPGVYAPLYYVHGYHPEFQRPNVPMVAVHAMPVPVPDLDISTRVLKQIEYYFSVENLVKDFYLREQMDREGGWVQLKLVARFNKVKELTDNIDLILEALQTSNVVEIQGDKLRRKGDWLRWILRSKSSLSLPPVQTGSASQRVARSGT